MSENIRKTSNNFEKNFGKFEVAFGNLRKSQGECRSFSEFLKFFEIWTGFQICTGVH